MTSFTRKLHAFDPSAARQIHRQELRDYRYGKHVTLAGFTLAAHDAAAAQPAFGKREKAPVLPAYACRAPKLGKPEAIVRAVNAYEARQQYAQHHGIALNEVMVRSR